MNFMKTALLLVILVALPFSAVAEELETEVTLLIGRPSAEESSEQGVLVVPGAVIPVTADVRPDVASALENMSGPEEKVANLVNIQRVQKIAANLQKSLRLSTLEVRYRMPLPLQLEELRELPAPASTSDVRLSVKLLGYSDTMASYEIQIHEGALPIAHTPISVPRGKQAVVGALDGADAPYLFLVIAPAKAKTENLNFPDGPVRVSDDIQPPIAIYKPMSQYTAEAKEAKIEGIIIVQTVIEKDGSVSEIKVLKGLSHGLEEAAVESIKQWRFEPALLDGVPIAVYYNLTINFRLASEDKADRNH